MADAKDSPSMAMMEPKSQHRNRNLQMAQDILRVLAIVSSSSSIAVMVTNKQTIFLFSLQFDARFYYSSSFIFLVAANGVECVFSVVTLLLFHFVLRVRQEAVSKRKEDLFYFFLFTHDIVMTVVLISGCAAATAIGYVGEFGEKHMFWEPLCDHVPKFCKTNLVSIFLSYLAFFAYFGLTILTAYKSMCISSYSLNNNN